MADNYSEEYKKRYLTKQDPSLAYSPIFQGIPQALSEAARTPQKTLAEYSPKYQQRYPEATQRLTEAERVPDIDFNTWPKQTGVMIDDRTKAGSIPLQELTEQPKVVFDPGMSAAEIQAVKTKMAGDDPKGYYTDAELAALNNTNNINQPNTLASMTARVNRTMPSKSLANIPQQDMLALSPYEQQVQRIEEAGFDPRKKSEFLGVATMPGLAMYSPETGWVQGMNPMEQKELVTEAQQQRGALARAGLQAQTARDVAGIQAKAKSRATQQTPQKRFSNVTFDEFGNTRDYDLTTGESRTNSVYDKYRQSTLDLIETNPELAANNISKLTKTDPGQADRIMNEMASKDYNSFTKIMDLLKRFK